MPVDPLHAKSLFLAAVEKAPAQRAAFLDEACGTDVELRQRVEQLLAAHDEPGSPLTVATREDTTGNPLPAPKGADIYTGSFEGVGSVVAGRYKLLQQIGEGGMGTVFMADQTQPVKRKVALKLVKAGLDSRTVLARFEAER